MCPDKYQTAVEIVEILTANGFQALFAGGFVRNRLLHVSAADDDIDIATDATPGSIAKIFPRVIGVGEHFGVMLVISNSISFEVATFRRDIGTKDGRHPESIAFSDAQADAQRRDFTINGMFYDPLTDQIHDYVNGRQDIQNRIVRTIGDPVLRFQEDYLRLLRAIRFAARFDFSIDPQTWDAILKYAGEINTVSQERIFQELTKMITGPNPDNALGLLEVCGLLDILLPEVQAMKGVEQPYEFHPEGDVLTHTRIVLSHLTNPSQTLAWSCLLHDIGKPATASVTDRIRFHNHHTVSAAMALKILQRLKSSRDLVDSVYECIENHMNFMHVTKMRLSTLKKFLARPTILDELELHRADCLASHGNIDNYTFLKTKLLEMAKETVKPEPLVKGRDLIALGFSPGPLFGSILGRVYDLQLEEKFQTREDALSWIAEHKEELLGNNG